MDNKLNKKDFIDLDDYSRNIKRRKKNLSEIGFLSNNKIEETKEEKIKKDMKGWFWDFSIVQTYQNYKKELKKEEKKEVIQNEKKNTNKIKTSNFHTIIELENEDTDIYLTNEQWIKILSHSNNKLLFDQNIFAIKSQIIKKGAPPERREIIWHYLSSILKIKNKYKNFKYFENIKKVLKKQYKQIEKDLHRTILPEFKNEKNKTDFIQKIQNILVAYSNINKKIGYVQGMNLIVSHLIYNVCKNNYGQLKYFEEQIFWLFVSLMEHYKINNIYSEKMEGIFTLTSSLENFLKCRDLELYNFIDEKSVF